MKKFLLLFVLVGVCLSHLKGNRHLEMSNEVFIDSTIVCTLNKCNISQTENDSLWDFSSNWMGTSNLLNYVAINEECDTILKIGKFSIYHLLVRQDSVNVFKYEDNKNLLTYDSPHLEYVCPSLYGDSVSETFSGVGRYCDVLKYRFIENRKTICDGCGTLILPTQDTLRNILRIREESHINCFAEDSLLFSRQKKFVRWHVIGHRHPIIEAVCGNKVIDVFYYPIEISRSEGPKVQRTPQARSTKNKENTKGDGFKINVSNKGSNIITLNCSSIEDVKMCYSIFSIDGICLYRSDTYHLSGSHSYPINMNNCQPGNYIVDIMVNNKHYTKKIIISE